MFVGRFGGLLEAADRRPDASMISLTKAILFA
jgi:hypothetical protein